jgi:hypothetical protein
MLVPVLVAESIVGKFSSGSGLELFPSTLLVLMPAGECRLERSLFQKILEKPSTPGRTGPAG